MARAIARMMAPDRLVMLLRRNGMKPSYALREELVERVAWAAVNGCLLHCPACHHSYLRWNAATAAFECPGTYDAAAHGVVDCGFTAAGDGFVRPVWSWELPVDRDEVGAWRRAGAARSAGRAGAVGSATRSPVRAPAAGVVITTSPASVGGGR